VSDKTYDGGVTAFIIGRDVRGRYADDDVYFGNLTAEFDGAAAGDRIRFSLSYDDVLAGSKAGNYYMDDKSAREGYAKISPAALKLTIDSKTKRYGDGIPDLTYSLAGFVNGESLPDGLGVSLSVAATAFSPVGMYAITCGNLEEIRNAAAPNYTVSVTGGNLNVTAAILSAVGFSVSSGAEKRYDGTPFVITASLGALEGRENAFTLEYSVNGARSTAAPRFSDCGTYNVFALATPAANYAFESGAATVVSNTSKFVITKAAVSVRVNDIVRDKTEGNPPFTFSIAESFSLVGGDTPDDLGGWIIDGNEYIGSPAGKYEIRIKFQNDRNYNVSVIPGTLTITDLFGESGGSTARTADGVSEIQFLGADDGVRLAANVYEEDSEEAKNFGASVSALMPNYKAAFVAEIGISGNNGQGVGVRIRIPEAYRDNKDCILAIVNEDEDTAQTISAGYGSITGLSAVSPVRAVATAKSGSLTRVNAVVKNGSFEFIAKKGGTYVILVPEKANTSNMVAVIAGAGGGGFVAVILLSVIISKSKKKRAKRKKEERERELLEGMLDK
jgi:hypothetical protein